MTEIAPGGSPATISATPMNRMRALGPALSEFGIGVALVAEILLFALLSPYFFTSENILNVSLQVSITAIIAVGMTFVILTGGIDLSVGAIVALSGVLTTSILKLNLPFAAAMPLAIAAGLLLGAISGGLAGIFVTRYSITPFIVTLAIMTIARGAAFMYTDGRPIWGLPEAFSVFGNGRVLQLPVPTIIMIALYVIAYIVLKKTRFGRYVYAVGGNSEAARLAGINVRSVLVRVYVVSGMSAALSGLLLASRMNSGQPNAGLMYELDVIAAVVVGGTSLLGGRGSIIGTFIGALLIGILRNGLNLLNVNSYVQQVIVGFVILLAVLLDQMRKRAGNQS